jgi:hypothetical protein
VAQTVIIRPNRARQSVKNLLDFFPEKFKKLIKSTTTSILESSTSPSGYGCFPLLRSYCGEYYTTRLSYRIEKVSNGASLPLLKQDADYILSAN